MSLKCKRIRDIEQFEKYNYGYGVVTLCWLIHNMMFWKHTLLWLKRDVGSNPTNRNYIFQIVYKLYIYFKVTIIKTQIGNHLGKTSIRRRFIRILNLRYSSILSVCFLLDFPLLGILRKFLFCFLIPSLFVGKESGGVMIILIIFL